MRGQTHLVDVPRLTVGQSEDGREPLSWLMDLFAHSRARQRADARTDLLVDRLV